jgi:hypothetical protein
MLLKWRVVEGPYKLHKLESNSTVNLIGREDEKLVKIISFGN